MRAWLIGDTHFGVKSGSNEWLDIQKDYFENFFIPTVKEHYQPGDILIHVGDVFDNRFSINVRVLNYVIDLFKRLGDIFDEMHVLIGNHDIFMKNSNDINSVKMLESITNLKIYETPEIISKGGKKLIMMPWFSSRLEEKNFIKSNSGDYVFAHTDINGLNFNKYTRIQDSLDLELYKQYKMVFSGHIHYTQKRDNVLMLGSPYAMTRNDEGNRKILTLLDIDSGQVNVFENKRSPEFIKLQLMNIYGMTLTELEQKVTNNFVDVYITDDEYLNFNVNDVLDYIKEHSRSCTPKITTTKNVVQDQDIDEGEFNLKSLTENLICNLPNKNDKVKQVLLSKAMNIFNETINEIK